MRIGSGPALAGSSESGQRSLAPVFEPIILVPLGERFLAEGELYRVEEWDKFPTLSGVGSPTT